MTMSASVGIGSFRPADLSWGSGSRCARPGMTGGGGSRFLVLSLSSRPQPTPSRPNRPGRRSILSIGRVEITLDLPKDKPYVGEMILLRMRSFIRADIVLDRIQQPPLLNFSWQQLGRDKPIQAMIDGFSVEPESSATSPSSRATSGRLIVEPFIRHVTVVNSDNQRIEADFASKPVYVDVQNYAAINPADGWWLPAKALTLTEIPGRSCRTRSSPAPWRGARSPSRHSA